MQFLHVFPIFSHPVCRKFVLLVDNNNSGVCVCVFFVVVGCFHVECASIYLCNLDDLQICELSD